MPGLTERLATGEVLVADGAIGTMLFARGLDSGDCPESVNLSHPEWLEEIARLYADAGADLVQTNTFGGSPLKLASYGLEARAAEINRAAVRAARAGVDSRALVVGSCGPSGRILKPYGDADPDELYTSFHEQVVALVEAGVDAVCVETMVDLREAELAVRAAKDVAPGTPLLATMTFDATPKGLCFTIMGTSVEQAAAGLRDAGADIVGANCGNGIERMVDLGRLFRGESKLPIAIQSNAGLPEMKEDRLVYGETPEFMADRARELLEIGVSIIGGCCGTTPEHTRALRRLVDGWTGASPTVE